MPAFHRKHSGSSKNIPVLLSSEHTNPSNVASNVTAHAEAIPDKIHNQVENAADNLQTEVDNVVDSVQNPPKNTSIPSKTVDHIKSYPLVQQTRSFLYGIPAARVLHANAKPLVKSVLESKPMQLALPVTNTVDTVANSSLSLTEKVIPSLKTKTYQKLAEEAKLPFTYTKKYSKQATNKTVELADQNVYQPAHNQVMKFRKYYNKKFYDTKGKPLVRSSLDPMTGPINNLFENLYIKWLPNGTPVSKDGYSSELNRSVALVINFFSRTIPVIEKHIADTSMMPCHYVMHVNSVFNKSLDKQPSLGFMDFWNASKRAISELEKEAIQYAKSHGPQKLLTKHKKEKIDGNVLQQSQELLHDHIEEVQAQIQSHA
ncbi:SPS4 (YOR313C) [Zygosaccharomyces parabailii]|uniref:BN860_13784g1_1 n=1 Tax=Zygosaccharomyces bailii (strain CLIB 213 / ATCC 58445 / CBS 680 / BCRC 21525 / NBRC 1098 / NCYC 1416 / NRRL Y-2227) TaxID=1333698 RepID=A0A8J2X9H3_ZYGB2|nr:SPS4 (YOR313C) [Zygosaccharomyces parabailii]CDF88588.1 BN860_13784g1_1 [Zygosaccharomyces bailii CLIB 213]CDH14533.1 uncharacterized protein ZBAI_06319 [Zygosaccharomyces bailii ISA1307]